MAKTYVYDSPKVEVNIVDKTTQVSPVEYTGKSIAFIGPARAGKVMEPQTFNSYEDFVNEYGEPLGYTGLGVYHWFNNGLQGATFIRIAGSTASARTVSVPGTAGESEVEDLLTVAYPDVGTLFPESLKLKVTTSGSKIVTEILKEDVTYITEEFSTDPESDDYIGKATNIGKFVVTNNFVEGVTNTLTDGTYTFSVGNDGAILSTSGDYELLVTAANKLRNWKKFRFDLVACCYDYGNGGYPKYIEAVTKLCDFRKDCEALIDIPFGKTYIEACKVVNNEDTDFPLGKRINNERLHTYGPWGRIYNEFSSNYEWVPGSLYMVYGLSKMYSQVEKYSPYDTPANLPKLDLDIITELEYNTNEPLADGTTMVDYCYKNGNINLVENLYNEGYTTLGAKTMLRNDTNKSDKPQTRVGCMYILNYIKYWAQRYTYPFIQSRMNMNQVNSWENAMKTKILDDMKASEALYDYQLNARFDADTIKQRVMPAAIRVKISADLEFVNIDIEMMDYEADFNS